MIQRLYTLCVQPLVPLCPRYFLTHPAEVLMRQLIWAEHPVIQLENPEISLKELWFVCSSGYAGSHASYNSCSHSYIYIYVLRCCTIKINNSLHTGTHSVERCGEKQLIKCASRKKKLYYFKCKHKKNVPFPRMQYIWRTVVVITK